MTPKLLLSGLLISLLSLAPAFGQGSDAALRDRVTQLVERLDSPKAEARGSAEKALIELGPKALPFLPDPSAKGRSAEQTERLSRVREALREAQDQANLGPAMVTIRGEGIRLTEAIKELQTQSGNVITDLREQFGAEVTNPALDLEIENRPFLEALDIVCKEAEVSPTFYTGDGSIGLMAGEPDLPNEIGGGGPDLKQRVLYSGPFRVVFKVIAASRDFANGTSAANAQFEIDWEPRIRPMLLSLKADAMSILDDRGEEVPPSVTDESSSVVLRADNPSAELNLNMSAPERAARTLATLKVKADVTVPAGTRSFRFPSLAKPATSEQGEISVKYEGTEVEEQVWKVRVALSFPGEGPAFESYRQGLLNNRLALVRTDGTRLDHNGLHGGGFSNTMSGAGEFGFEYIFVDVPGKPADYGLLYETPSKIVTIPLEFEYKDVPLP